MSHLENARINDAVARNVGTRWCSSCQMDKPAAGFVKNGPRWRCAVCHALRRRLKEARK